MAVADRPVQPDTKRAIHFGWVNYARGIAILLVVYRHCLVGLQRAGVEVATPLYMVQEFLYNVRMPVFFVLSGIFLTSSMQRTGVRILIRKKAANLLYPYVIWSVFLITLQWIFSAYTNSDRSARDFLYILLQPRELDHMWYLLALFNSTILYLLLSPLFRNRMFVHLALAVCLHFVSFYLGPWSFFSDIAYHYVFLVIGAVLSDQVVKLEMFTPKRTALILLLIIPLFIAGQLYWLRTIGANYQSAYWWELAPYLLIILVACFVFYLVSRLLEAWGKLSWLSTIGSYSLYIYILHIHVIAFVRIFFVRIAGTPDPYLVLATSIIAGILVPILVYKLSSRLGWKFLFSAPVNTAGK